MSYQDIYIELQGKTSDVRPRYIRTLPPRPRSAVPGSHGAVFRNSHTPYAIRNSEIGIRNRGTGNLHGAVFSLLTLMDMVR